MIFLKLYTPFCSDIYIVIFKKLFGKSKVNSINKKDRLHNIINLDYYSFSSDVYKTFPWLE